MYRLTIATMLILAIAVGGYTQTSRLTTNSSSPSYGKEQADRGKALYSRYCSKCHLENLKGSCPSEDLSSTSYICAATGSAPPLTGASFMHRFHSAGDLYSRVKWTMPADKGGSLSVEDNLSLVSYLLQTNGLPAGPEDLKAGTAMKSMVLAKDAPANRGSSAPERLNSLGISQAYYTENQAERGKAYFYAACGVCHTADPKSPYGTMDPSTGLGWHRGPVNSYGLFVGDAWLASASGVPGRPQRWDTVADLYNKIRTTQPAYDVAGLSTQEYLDIVAYLLKQNGLPAGKEELKNDLSQMRNMTLDKGFERLFNGKDFTGWGFVVGPNCKPRPEGCGDTSPGSTFKVDDGMILNTGSPHGYMYPLKKFWNFTNRIQVWRATTTCSPTLDICCSLPNMMFGRGRWKFREKTISKCRSPWAETNRHIRLMTPRARGLANQRGNGTQWRSSLRMASSGHTSMVRSSPMSRSILLLKPATSDSRWKADRCTGEISESVRINRM